MSLKNLEVMPCLESWESMEVRPGGRHCNVCNMQVYDLSAMTEAEAEVCLASGGKRQICVRFTKRDGQIEFRDSGPKPRLPVLAMALPLLVAACNPSSEANLALPSLTTDARVGDAQRMDADSSAEDEAKRRAEFEAMLRSLDEQTLGIPIGREIDLEPERKPAKHTRSKSKHSDVAVPAPAERPTKSGASSRK
jgi:hypothetical protein